MPTDRAPVLDAAFTLAIRRALYANGSGISPQEAERIVALNDAAEATSPEWRALFVEALTDFAVRQQAPQGYVDERGAAWLTAAITRDGVVRGETELELLIHVLEAAESAPEALCAFVLRQCVAAVRAPEPGIAPRVDAGEVELLRRALYAGAGESGIGVSREEADALFDINDVCKGGDNAPGWRDLFVHGVANHLLVASTYHARDAAMALADDAWMHSKPHLDVLGLLTRPWSETVREAFASDDPDWAGYNAAEAAAQAEAHILTVDERAWLKSRIARDGVRDANEDALLRFVFQDAAEPPSTTEALSEAPAPAGPAPAAPVFGRRMRLTA